MTFGVIIYVPCVSIFLSPFKELLCLIEGAVRVPRRVCEAQDNLGEAALSFHLSVYFRS